MTCSSLGKPCKRSLGACWQNKLTVSNMKTETTRCYGCGALVDDIEGRPHSYLGTAQGCWDLFGQILVKEYGEYNYPETTHRLSVDTYAIQHPGQASRQSKQSVNVHLIGLHFILLMQLRGNRATEKIGALLAKAPKFEWLEPPVPNGQKTVLHVLTATNREEHELKVRQWATDVYTCWYTKHSHKIEGLVEQCF